MPIFRLYNRWKAAICQLRPGEHQARVKSVVWLLVGMTLSRAVQVHHVAAKLPGATQTTSKVRRLRRLLANVQIRVRAWHEPLVRELLATIVAHGQPLRLLIDATPVGRNHQLLMVTVAYRRRALPLVWTWKRGRRGHSSAYKQGALLAYLQRLLPPEAEVVLVGDSEFGSVRLMQRLEAWGWRYALRQKGNLLVRHPSLPEPVRLEELVPQPGTRCWLRAACLTQQHPHRVNLLAVWQRGQPRPLLLATNLPSARATRRAYSRRAWIDEMFGDFKRHGLDLATTHLRHVQRLSRLVLALVLLYRWLVATGSSVIKRGLRPLVDRSDRRDRSIFRIGLEMFERRWANHDPPLFRLMPYF